MNKTFFNHYDSMPFEAELMRMSCIPCIAAVVGETSISISVGLAKAFGGVFSSCVFAGELSVVEKLLAKYQSLNFATKFIGCWWVPDFVSSFVSGIVSGIESLVVRNFFPGSSFVGSSVVFAILGSGLFLLSSEESSLAMCCLLDPEAPPFESPVWRKSLVLTFFPNPGFFVSARAFRSPVLPESGELSSAIFPTGSLSLQPAPACRFGDLSVDSVFWCFLGPSSPSRGAREDLVCTLVCG